MALKRNETYPGRFSNPTGDHPQGAFKNRSAPGAQDGSYLEQQWANDWDGFFGRLLTVAGITPDGNVDTALSSQYYDALVKVIINSAGSPPIGIPFFWPLAAMPNTVMPEWSDMVFLKLNDATFSAAAYPKLALVWPDLKLTDTRGEFIRTWDDGRGVDTGRTLLSAQGDAIRNITGSINSTGAASSGAPISATGAFTARTGNFDSVASGPEVLPIRSFDMDVSSQVPTASENRPRNIAFNFIVRAK